MLALRFVPPYRSALMLQTELASWIGSGSHGIEHTWVALDDISPHMALAVIAAEDQKFLTHHGFDREAIERAIAEREERGSLRGASTISQQVAKNVFLWPGRSFVRKGLEAGWTGLLELLWPKRRIVEVYINVAEFGEGVFGVEAASRRFFQKPSRALSAEEAALLAAVLPSPRRFRVGAPSAYVRKRQEWILTQMQGIGGTAHVESLYRQKR